MAEQLPPLRQLIGRFNLTELLAKIKGFTTGPLLDTAIILIVLYIILRLTKFILGRLQQRDVIPGAVAEQLYRLTSLALYITVAMLILYIFTSAKEVIYSLIILFIAFLIANWNIIADIASYYVMLSSRHIYRTASLIELPRINVRGKIVGMTLLFTKIRTPAGRIVYIPNHIMVNEPIIQLTTIQSFVEIELKADIKGLSLEHVERKIRTVIAEARLATRPQDVVIAVNSLAGERADITVRVPVAGIEPRPSTINSLVEVLAKGLKDLNPEIKVKSLL